MRVEVRLDASCKEPKIVVVADRMTDEIGELVRRLSQSPPQVLVGFRDGGAEVLDPRKIRRVYTANGKVFAAAEGGDYLLRMRLYELENRLDRASFVRISNSEIVNLKRVRGFDLSFAGTIRVTFDDGTATYVSRRYVARIKQVLGI